MLYVWYPKSGTDLSTVHEENDVIETQEKLATVKKQLRQGKHTCLIIRNEHPRAYEICSNCIHWIEFNLHQNNRRGMIILFRQLIPS